MELCSLPEFELPPSGLTDDDRQADIGAAFHDVGAVLLKSVLSKQTASALLAHINARLAEEVRRKAESEKTTLKREILKILGDVPAPTAHSLTEIVDFVLATWSGATPTLDKGVEALLCMLSEPDLDARIDEHNSRQGAAPGEIPAHRPAFFGNVHESTCRWDFRLELDEVVAAASAEILVALSPVIRRCTHAGEHARLCELSSIVSDPGSPRQPLHTDTLIESADDSAENHIVTCFVALQPINASMGPTVILPSSHNLTTHAWLKGQQLMEKGDNSRYGGAVNSGGAHADRTNESAGQLVGAAVATPGSKTQDNAAGGGEQQDVCDFAPVADSLPTPPATRRAAACVCDTGDVVMMDSRAAHFGGANQSDRRRVLFYFSFHSGAPTRRPAFGSTLSLLPEYEGRFGLAGPGVALPPWTKT
jgi:ectoine hydroxylase-related dioxygenase (phytanoyl-CoA dioxygenase family)